MADVTKVDLLTMSAKQNTIAELKAKLRDAWLRGKDQRVEIGTLLLALRAQAEHGTWGKLLAEIGIPATTAADYMVEASRQIHGIRVFGPQPDPEAQEMEEALNAATVLVKGAGPSDDSLSPIPIAQPKPKRAKPQLEQRSRVRGPVLYCTATQKEAYQAAKKEYKERVYQTFYDALMVVIAEQQEEAADETLATQCG
ncbi:MAG: hypothetical protein LAN18_09035 [Acidobacteriia bacterium]|nr:hypothetical protein [Terriglobia bacterium]